MSLEDVNKKARGILTLSEYKRFYCLASELDDRAEINRLETLYLIDDNCAMPMPTSSSAIRGKSAQ